MFFTAESKDEGGFFLRDDESIQRFPSLRIHSCSKNVIGERKSQEVHVVLFPYFTREC